MERRKPSTTVGANVHLYNHYVYQHGDSSEKLKKKKKNYHMIQLFHFWVFIQRI